MNDKTIKNRLKEAIKRFYKHDSYLIENDLSEPSLTHKLAEHLQVIFKNYHVDCEYNRHKVLEEQEKKKIKVLKDDLQDEEFLIKSGEGSDLENELIERAVFPDIIVHDRGNDNNNLCIIEVKKSSSSVSSKYDEIKLKSYTSNHGGNSLHYRLGVFFKIKEDKPCLKYFKNGQEITN